MSLEEEASRRQLRALSHPVRLRILSLASGAAMSAAELARELGMNHAAVSFHVRQLVAAGFLTLAETRSVRGGQERRYRHEPARRGQWQDEDARLTVRAVSEEVLRRLADVPSVHWRLFADAELWVDPATWAEATGRIAAATRDLQAAALPPHATGALHVSATAMLFAADDREAGDRGAGERDAGDGGTADRDASGADTGATDSDMAATEDSETGGAPCRDEEGQSRWS
ncbi:MAG TPA: winged helix-turn-helix domain-containing protein [Streptosporangiaceae bacterium]|jgi:DNA-binding transcriptional ArsR family regulator